MLCGITFSFIMKFFQLNSFEVSKNPNVLDSFKNKSNLGIEITDTNITSR